jgi:tetratricopeptide (TPR) repeat protein
MLFILLLLLFASSLPGDVTVSKGTISLPTYEEAPPDENPPFPRFKPELPQPVYPYTIRPKSTNTMARKTWRTLEIDNEYLHCIILPDLGGRIYSCIDKVTKHDLFYANQVIKKWDAGTRGAWAGAGTEVSFPIGHPWSIVSPVDYATRQNEDGSASVFTGNTDRVYGLRWLVETVLRPGSSLVEQRVTLSNPTNQAHPYLWWNIADIESFADTRFIFPCYLTSDHGGKDIQRWPVNAAGTDMSLVSTNTNGGARFAYECREGFAAVYSAREAFGTAHYADPRILTGKKVYTLGSGESVQGVWKFLNDNGSQFVELQSGLFRDQETFGSLGPQLERRFVEYWLPLRGLGSLTRANEKAAVHLERHDSSIQIKLQVFQASKDARVRLSAGGQKLMDQSLTLEPGTTWAGTANGAGPNYQFELLSGNERMLFHQESLYDAAKEPAPPVDVPAKFEGNSTPEAGAFEAARLRISGKTTEAAKTLEPWFAADPAHSLVRFERTRLGMADQELWKHLAADPERVLEIASAYMRAGLYTDAIAALSHAYFEFDALEREPGAVLPQHYPLVNYYLGYCKQKLGQPGHDDFARASKQSALYVFPNRPESIDVLQAALKDDPNDAAAHYYLGLLYFAADKVDPAIEQWRRASELHAPIPALHASLGRALRDIKKDTAAATKVFEDGFEFDPLNPVIQDGISKGFRDKRAELDARTKAAQLDAVKKRAELAPKAKAPPTELVAKATPPPSIPHERPSVAPSDKFASVALSMLESGRTAAAAEVFTEENFPNEHENDLVRRVFIEVRLQKAIDLSRKRKCADALAALEALGDEDPKVPFSMYGFNAILKNARIQYLIGTVEDECGEQKAARKSWSRAAKAGDAAYSQLASIKLNESATSDLRTSLAQVQNDPYARGLLQRASSRKAEADASFQEGLRSTDPFVKYLCAIALQGK